MDGSLSHFKATLQRKKVRADATSDRFKRTNSYINNTSKLEFKTEELSESELQELKRTIRVKLNFRKKLEAIILIILIVSSLALVVYFIN